MASPRTLRVSLLVGAVLLVDCSRQQQPENTPLDDPPLGIELTVPQALQWTYQHEVQSDLDGDGTPESVTLASDVVVSPEGRPMWEDGHRWALVIKEADHATLAYSAFVPRGFVEAALLQASSDGTRRVLVQERTPEQMRAMEIGYDRTGESKAMPVAYHQIQSWLPGSATLPE